MPTAPVPAVIFSTGVALALTGRNARNGGGRGAPPGRGNPPGAS